MARTSTTRCSTRSRRPAADPLRRPTSGRRRVGERFRRRSRADPRCRVYVIYRQVRQPGRLAAVQTVPADDEGAALPVYPAGWSSTTSPATAATTARSSSSTTRSASSAATTSGRRTPPSGATRTCGSPAERLGPQARLRGLLEPQPPPPGSVRPERPLLLETASTWETAHPVPPQRAAAVDVPHPVDVHRGHQPRLAQRGLTQAYFCPTRDCRRRDQGRCRARVDVRLLVPLKSNHIVADWISRGYFSQLLRPACGSSVTATRWCTRRRRRSITWSTVGTANVDRLQPGKTTRSTSRSSTRTSRPRSGRSTTDESELLRLTQGEVGARDLHLDSPRWCSGRCAAVLRLPGGQSRAEVRMSITEVSCSALALVALHLQLALITPATGFHVTGRQARVVRLAGDSGVAAAPLVAGGDGRDPPEPGRVALHLPGRVAEQAEQTAIRRRSAPGRRSGSRRKTSPSTIGRKPDAMTREGSRGRPPGTVATSIGSRAVGRQRRRWCPAPEHPPPPGRRSVALDVELAEVLPARRCAHR